MINISAIGCLFDKTILCIESLCFAASKKRSLRVVGIVLILFYLSASSEFSLGCRWEIISSSTGNNLYWVWGTASSDVYAVGQGGIILHYNGAV
ncbi:MAG: hypothetical protein A2161_16025 [Candidatus Schekmanbacteria bacterium RBG_13_48_7]|uniref:Uncharacterized protein n=1 Tax=Candidatus Schekmanbacteria bacterium RBG_13_48_7 TaxID=1817878 RepID=A0A1F7RR56_9BACT|nr:MAG: hypothetical protein A2161_16025 [Candidatus Schekmanbacteria bacterium RBG_13_48_7]